MVESNNDYLQRILKEAQETQKRTTEAVQQRAQESAEISERIESLSAQAGVAKERIQVLRDTASQVVDTAACQLTMSMPMPMQQKVKIIAEICKKSREEGRGNPMM